ncbi:MAG: hypothetical protein MJ210_04770, partial [Alphaproteobacteria bacterium]|nr:hypothetical protein [Alphaproteobacteria bacterium]
MMETLGVLTIIVMLGTSVISLIGNIWGIFKQNMVVNEARDLQQAVSAAFKADGNYDRLFEGWSEMNDKVAEQRLCNEKIAPFQMCSNGELHHRQSGRVWVYPVGHDKYRLTFKQLPKKTCVALAEVNWFLQKKPDIYQMIINPENDGTGGFIVNLPQNAEEGAVNLYNFSVKDAMDHCTKQEGNEISIE